MLRRSWPSRAAFVVTGGTGSGKTTLLAALLAEVDPARAPRRGRGRHRAAPDHPHVVGLEARPANVEGAGLVTVRDLVRQALRMRPDRLVVGEVRGAEVVDLLAALNTGHEGGCGTVHANSTVDVPARFEALGVAAGLPREAVHSQLAAGIDLVVHLGRASEACAGSSRSRCSSASATGWWRACRQCTFAERRCGAGPGRDGCRGAAR